MVPIVVGPSPSNDVHTVKKGSGAALTRRPTPLTRTACGS